MRQLTSLDAQFLAAENGRMHGHVSAVCILDPATTPTGTLTIGDIRQVFEERLHLLPPMRWRLLEVPMGIDYPYWYDDPNFDLEFHLREEYLPPPGTMEQLAAQVSRIVSRPLDRGYPLWECYLIGGLEDGKVALLVKMHHALVDGMSGAEILGILFDTSPDGREVPPRSETLPAPVSEPVPTPGRLLARGVADLPRQVARAARALPETLEYLDTLPTMRNLPGLRQAAAAVHRNRTRDVDGRVLEAPAGDAPRTKFNGKISAHRRIEFVSLSLPEIKAVKNAFGGTVNDVVVALCTSAIRDWLVVHDDLPEEPLLSMVPVSVRSTEEMGTFGNRISVMIVPLATDEPDPVERLRRTHEILASAKDRHSAVPADILASTNQLIPPSIFARAARVTAGLSVSHRFAPPYNVIISNVPGPPIPIYVAGARQVASYPVSFIVDGAGLNFTVFSYLDHVDFGLVADRTMVPDLDLMVESLKQGLADLLAAAAAPV